MHLLRTKYGGGAESSACLKAAYETDKHTPFHPIFESEVSEQLPQLQVNMRWINYFAMLPFIWPGDIEATEETAQVLHHAQGPADI